MQLVSLLFWLAGLFLVAKIVNYFARRALMNPWLWLAGSYAFFYIAGIFLGLARNAPNLAYAAGSFLPITALAVGLGLWRAPKWHAAQGSRSVANAPKPPDSL